MSLARPLSRFLMPLALSFGLVLAACGEGTPPKEAAKAPAAPPPPEVVATIVKAADVPLSFEYAGRAAGIREVEVRARVGGILQKRMFVEGQAVKEGDVLFQIDPAPYEAALSQARAQLQQEQARLVQAEQNWARIQPLVERGFTSRKDRDDAQSNLNLARGSVAQAQAQVKTATINLGYTKVTAPVGGVTSRETVSEGSLIGTSQADSLLTKITQTGSVYVNFAIPDTEASFLRQAIATGRLQSADGARLPVEVRPGGGVQPITGVLDFTDSSIDVATGTVRARARIENQAQVLTPGQFVRVVVRGVIQPNAIAIPAPSLMQGPQGTYVLALGAEDKVEVRPIKVGRQTDKGWLVDSGLKDGDRVIVEGVMKARPGQPVRIAQAQPPSPPPGAPQAAPQVAPPAAPAAQPAKAQAPAQ